MKIDLYSESGSNGWVTLKEASDRNVTCGGKVSDLKLYAPWPSSCKRTAYNLSVNVKPFLCQEHSLWVDRWFQF